MQSSHVCSFGVFFNVWILWGHPYFLHIFLLCNIINIFSIFYINFIAQRTATVFAWRRAKFNKLRSLLITRQQRPPFRYTHTRVITQHILRRTRAPTHTHTHTHTHISNQNNSGFLSTLYVSFTNFLLLLMATFDCWFVGICNVSSCDHRVVRKGCARVLLSNAFAACGVCFLIITCCIGSFHIRTHIRTHSHT